METFKKNPLLVIHLLKNIFPRLYIISGVVFPRAVGFNEVSDCIVRAPFHTECVCLMFGLQTIRHALHAQQCHL